MASKLFRIKTTLALCLALLACATVANASVFDIFYKLSATTTTVNPSAVTIAAPSGYSYSAAAPVSGTTWNVVDKNAGIPASQTAGSTYTYSANNQAASGAVKDVAGNILSGVALTVTYTAVVANGNSEPLTMSGENTIQPGGVMQYGFRNYNNSSGNYYTFSFTGLPGSTPFDLYIYGGTSTTAQGTGCALLAANALGANPTSATTANSTLNSASVYGSLFTGTSPSYSLMASGTTWAVIHAQSDSSGNFAFQFKKINNNNQAYLNGFQLVRVPISTYSVTGGGSDCTSVAVGLSSSEAGVSYQLYNGITGVGSPVSGTGSVITFGAQTASGTYTVKGTVTDGTTTGLTATMTGSAVVTINAPTTISAASPASQSVSVSANVNIAVTVGGTTPTTYVWKKNGVTVNNGSTGNGSSTYSGATTATLTINGVQLGDSATSGQGYTCTVSGGCGSPTSTEATLSVTSGSTTPTIAGLTNQTVIAGNNATLSPSIGGTPTPTVQWYLSSNGGVSSNALTGATSATLTLTNVQYSQNNSIYYLVASNSVAMVVSNMTLTVTQIAPTIAGLTNQTVYPGNNATFSATVGGAPAPALQWLVNGTPITSATNSTLVVTNIHGSQNGYIYALMATNTAGTLTSNATLMVTSQMFCLNFDVNRNYAYQNSTAVAPDIGTNWNMLPTSGISSAFTSNNVTDSSAHVTACSITVAGSFNSWPDNSTGNPNPVNLMADYFFNGPYTITFSNLSQGTYALYDYAHGNALAQNSVVTVSAGNGSASASTTANATYTSNFRDTTAGPGVAYVVLNGTVGSSGTFTFTNASYLNGLQLQLVSAAGVTGLTNQTVIAGNATVLVPAVIGTAPLAYQWSSNGVAMANATNATLALSSVQYAQNGAVYSLAASNAAGADTNSMTLTVIVTPSITGLANQAVLTNSTATLSATVAGVPTPTLQWQFNGTNLVNGLDANGSTLSGSTSSSLGIANAQVADTGTYFLIASNSAGVVTNSLTLTVSAGGLMPVLTGPTSQTVVQSNNATFFASVTGLPVPTLQWLDQTGTPITGATSSTLTLTNVAYGQNGYTYSLVASNSAGVVTNGATLTVLVPVSLSGQPQNLVVTNTQSATFSVTAVGVPPPAYQWYYNASPISGATAASYTLANAAPTNMGSYSVVVTNSVNAITSAAATLTVNSTLAPIGLTPANGATGICYDTPLAITFSQTPVLRTAGKIRIYNVTNSTVPVDTIDLGLCVTNAPTYAVNVQPYTIGGQTFTNFPVILTGNTAAIYLHHGLLTSNQTYYVTVDDGTFADSVGAYFAGISATNAWSFTTKVSGPAIPTKLVVAADGSGDFLTVQGAVDSVPVNNTTPTVINIRNGTYTELVNINSRNNLDLRGQSRSGVFIGYPNNNYVFGGAPWRSCFVLNGNDCTLETLTVTNMTPVGGSQAEAMDVEGTRATFYNMELDSHQDTFLVHSAGKLVYFQDSLIQGDTDFNWGYGTVYYTNCELRCLSAGGLITQPRSPATTNGFGFYNCRITKGYSGSSAFYLGRTIGTPTTPSEVLFGNCLMDDAVTGYASDAGTNMADYACSNLTATAAKTVLYSTHSAGSDPYVIALQSAATWLYGWSPALSPNILSQPTNQAVSHGQSASFTVSATGMPAPTYQWLRNGASIAGATNATYTVASVVRTIGGNYLVMVSNASGSVTSTVASLTYNNTAPTATPATFNRGGSPTWKLAVSDLLTNASDADGDALTLVSLGGSTNGVTLDLTTFPGLVAYYNPNPVTDQFTYTVADGYGGTNTAVVTLTYTSTNAVTGTSSIAGITGSNPKMLTAFGIPDYIYGVQRSTNLTTWVDIGTTAAGTNGVISISDYFGDLGSNAPGSAYYRLKW